MLNDITYVKRPVGLPEDFPLNRFGFEAETSGFLQVETYTGPPGPNALNI